MFRGSDSKWEEQPTYAGVMAEEDDSAVVNVPLEEGSHPLDISADHLGTLQSSNTALEAVQNAADGQPC